ncbi:hypothetical protein NP233_g13052 [Leucocoprinus birnbaumii]|uniref:Uncharacterized protein n=1 Tax=Leucocoprinus birnbaumii TaxID=56174 RepID=A0AAD5VDM1_9AGAR|nr:hypothetical protein NP233_g13052 [Leucocoprinus birnbaumii]
MSSTLSRCSLGFGKLGNGSDAQKHRFYLNIKDRMTKSLQHKTYPIMPYTSKFIRTLTYHTRAINALKFSRDCSKLLSGGDDASVVVWDLKSSAGYQVIRVPLHGPVSAIAWTCLRQFELSTAFVFGCADGTLFLCEKDTARPHHTQQSFNAPIEDLAFDSGHHRLASVSREGVKIFEMDEQGNFAELASEPFEERLLPRGVVFVEEGKQIIVGFMESHELRVFNVNPWKFERSTRVSNQIGHLAISSSGEELVMSDLEKGLSLHTLPLENVPVQTATMSFRRKVTHRGIPLLVSMDDQIIVGGTDNGMVEVFDKSQSGLPHTLDHWKRGCPNGIMALVFGSQSDDLAQKMAQAAAVQKKGRKSYLVAAGTGATGNTELSKAQITLWKTQTRAALELESLDHSHTDIRDAYHYSADRGIDQRS